MKTTIKTLEFPSEFKNKLKMKVSFGNLDVSFIDGHIVKINHTNLSVQEPYKIIVKNKDYTLVAYLYDNEDKLYLPIYNVVISFTKYVSILNALNKAY